MKKRYHAFVDGRHVEIKAASLEAAQSKLLMMRRDAVIATASKAVAKKVVNNG